MEKSDYTNIDFPARTKTSQSNYTNGADLTSSASEENPVGQARQRITKAVTLSLQGEYKETRFELRQAASLLDAELEGRS